MRADAAQNRQRILSAAREQITASGVDVPMEQIARAAGVAVGTLYRHYPNKADLVAAILAEVSEEALQHAEQETSAIARPHEAAALIERLLGDLFEEAATNHAVKAAAVTFGSTHMTNEQAARGERILARLIALAQEDGDVRPTVTPADIFLIISTAPTGLAAPDRRRWLDLVLAGIRTR
ncbi:MAG TPA: helix-turn-helix domain-containing protein [Cellulomonas sp.]